MTNSIIEFNKNYLKTRRLSTANLSFNPSITKAFFCNNKLYLAQMQLRLIGFDENWSICGIACPLRTIFILHNPVFMGHLIQNHYMKRACKSVTIKRMIIPACEFPRWIWASYMTFKKQIIIV